MAAADGDLSMSSSSLSANTTTIDTAGKPSVSSPTHCHQEEEYFDEITTELGLGWAPYIPTKKTGAEPTKSGDDEDPDDLELRIGPPVQTRRRRVFPDGYWEITKTLTESDANGSSRLLLMKKYVEDHIIANLNGLQKAAIKSTTGMEIGVLDVDTDTQHTLVLKMWKSSRGYVLIKNWTCDFIKRRGLSENREIGLRWDPANSRLEFAVLN